VTTKAAGGASATAKTSTTKNAFPTQTSGSGGSGTGSSTGSSSNPNVSTAENSGGSKVPIGAIAGGAAGAVVLIILILFAGWRYRRRHGSHPMAPLPGETGGAPSSHPTQDNYDYGKAELASTSVKPVKSPILRKAVPIVKEKEEVVSPIEHTGLNELQSPPAPDRAEAPGNTNAAEMQGARDPAEVQNVERQQRSEMGDRNLDPVEMSATSGPFELHGHHEWRD
jgi:hypothetical protein